MTRSDDYATWFQRITKFPPHPWQEQLGSDAAGGHRLIRVPTGLGKTAGVVLAWLYHRVVRQDPAWPTRLVLTLPMRVLVEQTEHSVRAWIDSAGLAERVPVHVLMGGVRAEPWVQEPEAPAILLGTQDMLLSRGLNRGYGAARGRWPMDFSLLNQDALWVLDEVQLMDVGLMTSVQLAAFRAHDQAARPWFRPAWTWWMSATLQPDWLRSVDAGELIAPLSDAITEIPRAARQGPLWDIRKRAERRADVATPADLAALARERHQAGTLTLIIVNRVDQAVATHDALVKAWGDRATPRESVPELRLVHSRFRGAERRAWAPRFLSRHAELPPSGRIILSTQVIEAGVDISARLLITQLAPWSSLIQRAGRAARYPGEQGCVIVAGPVPERERDALPYELAPTAAADRAWQRLMDASAEPDASLAALTAFEDSLRRDDPAFLAELYPYAPAHVLQRGDLDALFDTSPDLSGADLDVSPFIRSGEERDVSVAWRAIEGAPRRIPRQKLPPIARDELCAVPVADARKWLRGARAYVLDYVDGVWVRVDTRTLAPGAVVIVAADLGGYSAERGFEPSSKQPVAPASAEDAQEGEPEARFRDTSAVLDDDSMSITDGYRTIATHGRETAEEVAAICDALGVPEPFRGELCLAARWHDAGKGHPVFQDAIKGDARASGGPRAQRRDLAKAPDNAWRRPAYPERPGFRHELASVLAMFELLRRVDPDHPALLGPHRHVLEAAGEPGLEVPPDERVEVEDPLARELAGLDAEAFDRVAYLVCSHHGKVRCTLASTPRDQERARGGDSMPIHGVRDGDEISRLWLADHRGEARPVAAVRLHVEDVAALGLSARYGASWTERVAHLRARTGPFTLAYLETLLRAADWRASRRTDEDPLES